MVEEIYAPSFVSHDSMRAALVLVEPGASLGERRPAADFLLAVRKETSPAATSPFQPPSPDSLKGRGTGAEPRP